jgi:hypothetical protein
MSAAPPPREQVMKLLDRLPPDRWPDVVRYLRSLLIESETGQVRPEARGAGADEEGRLVEIARRRLPPEAAARLRDLRARETAGLLQNADRAELHALEGRAERIDTERTAALLRLARIRGVNVSEIVRAAGLQSDEERH